ncbi:hypothetical protein NL676_012327 [Syzygium grande]|nr:hypothetical protein NL676_012327 [Syzygium grande]
MDEVFSQAFRLTPHREDLHHNFSAMVSHSTSGREPGVMVIGVVDEGFVLIGGRGGCDGGISGRDSRYCNHCQINGHTEAYCYTLHPELRPTIAAYVDSPALTSSEPPIAHGTGDTVTLSRTEYDTWLRSHQVMCSSAPTCNSHKILKSTSSEVSNSVTLADGSQSHVLVLELLV